MLIPFRFVFFSNFLAFLVRHISHRLRIVIWLVIGGRFLLFRENLFYEGPLGILHVLDLLINNFQGNIFINSLNSVCSSIALLVVVFLYFSFLKSSSITGVSERSLVIFEIYSSPKVSCSPGCSATSPFNCCNLFSFFCFYILSFFSLAQLVLSVFAALRRPLFRLIRSLWTNL